MWELNAFAFVRRRWGGGGEGEGGRGGGGVDGCVAT